MCNLTLLLADSIYYIHLSFIIIMLISPYMKMRIFHQFYYVMVPTLFVRWATNYSSCSVTLIESKLRGILETEGFIYKIITPIYEFKTERNFNIFLYIYMIITWLMVSEKLKYY